MSFIGDGTKVIHLFEKCTIFVLKNVLFRNLW